MNVADTSVWVEFLKHRQIYFLPLSTLLDQQQVGAVECVFGELLQVAKTASEQSMILGYCHNPPKRSEIGLWVEAGNIFARNTWHAKGVGLIDAFPNNRHDYV